MSISGEDTLPQSNLLIRSSLMVSTLTDDNLNNLLLILPSLSADNRIPLTLTVPLYLLYIRSLHDLQHLARELISLARMMNENISKSKSMGTISMVDIYM